MTYSCSDFANDVENLCRAHGYKSEKEDDDEAGALQMLLDFLKERIPPKRQQVFAWMTESFDRGMWNTGFVGANIPGIGYHVPLVMRNPVIMRSMGRELAEAHGKEHNQTTWHRTYTHYVDEEAIYLRPEGTMPK